jgi:hypothetical protein
MSRKKKRNSERMVVDSSPKFFAGGITQEGDLFLLSSRLLPINGEIQRCSFSILNIC